MNFIVIFGPPAVGKMTAGYTIKINNTTLAPQEAARRILDAFGLQAHEQEEC